MALSLITNMGANIAANALANNQTEMNQTVSQLATGQRIVNAAIDPAGLAISLEMSGLLGSLNQDSTNAANAQGMLQTADGALANIGNALVTMQQIANESADGTVNNTQRQSLDAQFQQLYTEINNIAQSTEFNGISLLQGQQVTFQVGPSNSAQDQLVVSLPNVSAGGLLSFNVPSTGLKLSSDNYYGVTFNYNNESGASTGGVSPVVSYGTGTTLDTGTANLAASSGTSGVIGPNSPNWVMLTVQSISSSGTAETTGSLSSDTITFSITTANGQNEGTVTLSSGANWINNLGGSGADFSISTSSSVTFAVGQEILISLGPNLMTQGSSQTQISSVSTALSTLAGYRGSIGAYEQQLSTISSNLQSESQNLTAALSNIQDANVATTFAQFTKQLVLEQSGVAVLKNAEQIPQQLAQLI